MLQLSKRERNRNNPAKLVSIRHQMIAENTYEVIWLQQRYLTMTF